MPSILTVILQNTICRPAVLVVIHYGTNGKEEQRGKKRQQHDIRPSLVLLLLSAKLHVNIKQHSQFKNSNPLLHLVYIQALK